MYSSTKQQYIQYEHLFEIENRSIFKKKKNENKIKEKMKMKFRLSIYSLGRDLENTCIALHLKAWI